MPSPLRDRPVLLHGKRRIAIPDAGLTVGRGEGNDVPLQDAGVSRRHAILHLTGDAVELEDCGSTNGTRVNGALVRGGRRPLAPGDVLEIGSETLRLLAGGDTGVLERPSAGEDAAFGLTLDGAPVTLGRDPSNGAVLDDPNVSRFHVELTPAGAGFNVRDLGSRNGTWIDGRRVEEAHVAPGEALRVGRFRIVVEPDGRLTRSHHGQLEASDVAVIRGGEQIVPSPSLSVRSGELVALIGRSGSGKTSLVKALAGVIEPDAGVVTLDGDPVRTRLPEVGYLPQDEIVHPQLTPREALGYAARLRLPSDLGREELDRLVDATLAVLDLADRADVRIGDLSGGERKRAGLAVELLGRPRVLFLDEPTTGLDPGLEGQTMELLARLAADGRAVVVVTHATASLELCDRLAVMGPGGRLHFLGPPRDALAHFGVETYEEIYAAVADAPTPPPLPPVQAAPPSGVEARPHAGLSTQVRVLVARYARTFVRDRRNLAILLLQVPVLGIALGLLFGADVFARARRGNPNDVAQILFLLSTTVTWLGAIAAAREIVKERSVLARERAVGVRVSGYLASKCIVLFSLAALMTVVLTAVVVALRPLHAPAEAYAAILAITVATAIVAAALGLTLSVAARSQDQATSFIPLALVPQLLFAGALVPVSKMGDAMGAVSAAMPSRWSFASLGTALDMADRLKADPYDARYSPFKQSFFDVAVADGLLILGGFACALLALTALLLRRRAALDY